METRISGAKADVFIKHNGFHCSHQMEAEGFSSGIWILWNNAYEVNIIWNHKQYIHFQVSENSSLFLGSLLFMQVLFQLSVNNSGNI